jgi:hypothetical protein
MRRRFLHLALLLPTVCVLACEQPTQAEIAAQVSGSYHLVSVAGRPLPYVETRAGETLEIRAGVLILGAEPLAQSRYGCSFSLAYSVSRGGSVTDAGTETVPCTFFRFIRTGIHFELTGEAEHVRRLENQPAGCTTCISGTLIDRSVTIEGRNGVEYIFRK